MTTLRPQENSLSPHVTASVASDTPQCVVRARNVIGESPIWLAESGVLVWADIESRRVYRYDARSGQVQEIPVDFDITALVPTSRGDWIAASRTGLYRVGTDFDWTRRIGDPEESRDGIRLNDSVADQCGRLWTGSLNESNLESADGRLYRLGHDLSISAADQGFAVANGVCMSPDRTRLYAVDMFHGDIRRYDHNPETGQIGPPSVWVHIDESEGKPDGLCCDREGGVWVCHWGGGCVSRFDPAGRLSHRIQLPVSQPTRCTFGGADLTELYICSARFELTPEAHAAEPEAGGLFRVRVPWAGLPEPRFSGVLPV